MRTYGQYVFDAHAQIRLKMEPMAATRFKRVFERADKRSLGFITLAATPENARELEWFMDRYPLDPLRPHDAEQLQRLAREFDRMLEAVAELTSPDYEPPMVDLAIPPRHYQLLPAAMLVATGGVLVGDEVGLGKAQPLSANVLTPSGWRRIGDLAIGDEVIDPDGGTAKVLGIYPRGVREVYRVTTGDGASTECCDEHLWLVQAHNDRSRRAPGRVLELRDFANDLTQRKGQNDRSKYFLPLTQPVEYAGDGPRPLHPYLLGCLLGDGGLRGSVCFTNPDAEVVERVRSLLPTGVVLKQRSAIDYCISCEKLNGHNPVLVALRGMNLIGKLSIEKHLPTQYQFAPVGERMALLRGLMDTDGDCSIEGTAMFNTSSPHLRDAVMDLVFGLGGIATYDERIPAYVHNGERRLGQKAYRVNVRTPFNPFLLKRKAERWRKPYLARAVKSIEPVGHSEMVCISVSSKRNLYVTDGFIVTHNTVEGIVALAKPDALPALVVTLTALPKQWQREIERFAPTLKTYVLQRARPFARGATGYGAQDLAKAVKQGAPLPDVVITSYSKIHGWAEWIVDTLKPRSVIWDEVQEARRGFQTAPGQPNLRNLAMRDIAKVTPRRMGLSATPIHNEGAEIHNVMEVIAPGALGEMSEFKREWCASGGNVKDPKVLGSYLRERGLFVRRTKKEVGRELPPLTISEQYCETDPKAIEALKSSSRAIELAQMILSGKRQDAFTAQGEFDMFVRQQTGLAKAPFVAAFVRMLLESEKPIVLAGWHHAVYDTWAELLKEYQPAFFTGRQTPKEKDEAVRRFRTGETKLFIMSLRAGAGLDGLQYAGCSDVVFGELDWTPAVHEQFIGRVRRDGNDSPVTAWYLVADEGSDPEIAVSLGIKRAQLEGIRDPKGGVLAGTVDRDAVKRVAAAFLTSAGKEIPKAHNSTPTAASTQGISLFASAEGAA